MCIARALIRKPSILLLDEPTASLDSQNEKLIFETLKQLSKKNDRSCCDPPRNAHQAGRYTH